MDKMELDQLIDKSIFGKLTPDEKLQLELCIKENPDATEETKLRVDIMKAFEYTADQEYKSLLNRIHDQEISISSRRPSIRRRLVVLAGLILTLGIFGVFKYLNDTSNSSAINGAVLYAKHFEPYIPSVEVRSNEQLFEEDYKVFIDLYRERNYVESLELIRPKLDETDNKTLLLAGICAMQSDKNQESIRYLDKIIASNDYYFIDQAKWYKSLVLVKMGNIQEAKILLEELTENPEADHYNESLALLREI